MSKGCPDKKNNIKDSTETKKNNKRGSFNYIYSVQHANNVW